MGSSPKSKRERQRENYVDMVVNMLAEDVESLPSASNRPTTKKKKKKRDALRDLEEATFGNGALPPHNRNRAAEGTDNAGTTSGATIVNKAINKQSLHSKPKKKKKLADDHSRSRSLQKQKSGQRKRSKSADSSKLSRHRSYSSSDEEMSVSDLRNGGRRSTASSSVRHSAIRHAQQERPEYHSGSDSEVGLHDSGISGSTALHDSGISSALSVEDWSDEVSSNEQSSRDGLIKQHPHSPTRRGGRRPPALTARSSAPASLLTPTISHSEHDVENPTMSFAGRDAAGDEESVHTQVPAPPQLRQSAPLVQPGAFRMSSSEASRANVARPLLTSIHGEDAALTRTSAHTLTRASTHTGAPTRQPPPEQPLQQAQSTSQRSLLLEAMLVPDTSAVDVVEAKVFDEKRAGCGSRLCWCLVIVVLLLLAGAGATVVVLYGSELGILNDDGGGDSGDPSLPPPATTPEEEFRLGLPQATQAALESSSSPQSTALKWLEEDPALESRSLQQKTQRFALGSLFYATGGADWANKDSWLAHSAEECQWHSTHAETTAICDDNNNYVVLSLADNDLAGSIPGEIGLLNGLQSVDLSSNSLTGQVPAEVGNLLSLVKLNLSFNGLSGGLPPQISQLGPTLEVLSLASNGINGTIPSELGSLTRLATLELHATLLTGAVPTELCTLVEGGLQLTVNCDKVFCACDCSCVEAVSPTISPTTAPTHSPTVHKPGIATLRGLLPDYTLSAIEDRTSAQYAAIAWMAADPGINDYEDFRLLQRFAMATLYFSTNGGGWLESTGWLSFDDECGWFSDSSSTACTGGVVTRLVLTRNELEGSIPAELEQLSSLEVLHLYDNIIAGPIPTTLGSMATLKDLRLDFNYLDGLIPTELGNLNKLTNLDIEQNNLIGDIPDELGRLGALESLRLTFNFLTGPLPEALGDLLNLELFMLRENSITGSIPDSYRRHVNMVDVDFAKMNLTGEVKREQWIAWDNADGIDIGKNSFHGRLATEIGTLSKMTYLDVYANQFDGPLPTELGLLANLQTLYLEDNLFTGNIPTEIGRLSKLQLLHIYSNRMSGNVPEQICELVRNNNLQLALDCDKLICPVDCDCLCDYDPSQNANQRRHRAK